MDAQPRLVGTSAAAPGLDARRLGRAQRAFTTRNVLTLADPLSSPWSLATGVPPREGDLVLARVTEIGQHQRLERPDGRRACLFPGDEIVVAYGARYAPDQFLAEVPADLGPCHLAAAGGVAGRVVAAHADMDDPTCLEPVGLLADEAGAVVSLHDHAPVGGAELPGDLPPLILVAGTAMNAGKTTAAAHLVRGLTRSGFVVGAAKVTGTGAGGDLWLMRDAGAAAVLDFTDAGWVTTAGIGTDAARRVLGGIARHLADRGCDALVVEVADGLAQAETAGLLRDRTVRAAARGVLFAAGDALGASAGVSWLREAGHHVLAVSGRLTAAPLAQAEADATLDVPVVCSFDLAEPTVAASLLQVVQPAGLAS
ncbi:MAG: hypothetical protein ACLGIV_08430 [Actinomycetes bacterium]